jgi:hypothetical protein
MAKSEYGASSKLIMEEWPNYDFDEFKSSDLSRSARAIYICALENVENAGDGDIPPTNYWGAFLLVGEDTSVGVDMAGDYGHDGRRGKIHVSSNSFPHANDEVKTLRFNIENTRTVRQIFELINSKGRDKYRFTDEIEGCRYWMWKFISDLEAAGIVRAGSSNWTWAAVSFYWTYPRGSGQELRAVKRGQFYTTYPQGPGDDDEADNDVKAYIDVELDKDHEADDYVEVDDDVDDVEVDDDTWILVGEQ